MFGFFKKKEVAPQIKEEVIIPKHYAERVIKLYGESLVLGLRAKYELWSLIETAVGEEIEAVKKKYPKVEKFKLAICVEDVLSPTVVITQSK